MNDQPATQPSSLAEAIRRGREAAGLSVRQLELQSGVTKSMISRIEHAEQDVPSASALIQLARALELRATDLFLLAGLPLPNDLPTLPAMLRAEYDLPPEAIAEIQQNIERVASKYRRPGEKKIN